MSNPIIHWSHPDGISTGVAIDLREIAAIVYEGGAVKIQFKGSSVLQVFEQISPVEFCLFRKKYIDWNESNKASDALP